MVFCNPREKPKMEVKGFGETLKGKYSKDRA